MANGASKLKPKVPTGRGKVKHIHYKIIIGTAEECENKLNGYSNSGALHKVVSMQADYRLTTILVELYS